MRHEKLEVFFAHLDAPWGCLCAPWFTLKNLVSLCTLMHHGNHEVFFVHLAMKTLVFFAHLDVPWTLRFSLCTFKALRFSLHFRVSIFTHSDTHYTPSNALQIQVKIMKGYKVLDFGLSSSSHKKLYDKLIRSLGQKRIITSINSEILELQA